MSLLNNMLNDIEKRRALAAAQSLPESVVLTTRSRRSGGNSLLLLGLVSVAVAVAAFVWFNYQKINVQPVAAANIVGETPHDQAVTPIAGAAADSGSAPIVARLAAATGKVITENPAASADNNEALKVVNDWAAAWSSQNVDAYLAFYAADFMTPRGESRADWVTTRRDRISKPTSIKVSISNAKVSLQDGSHATVTFRQSYLANLLKNHSSKTLLLVKANGKWLIREERSGANPLMSPDTSKAISKAPDRSKALSMSQPSSDRTASFKTVSPQQRSDNYYRQALTLLQQSRDDEAKQALQQALEGHASNHPARQLLAELLADTGRNAEAEALLREGLSLAPGNIGFGMTLAQMQAVGDLAAAVATLKQGLKAAGDDAAYHAMLAALLLKQGQHAEAIPHYITALRSNPMMSNWLIGAGISMQAENKWDDADAAFQRALDIGELSDEVAQFVSEQLALIRQQRK